MRGRKTDPTVRAQAEDMIRKGVSPAEVARALHVGRSTVERIRGAMAPKWPTVDERTIAAETPAFLESIRKELRHRPDFETDDLAELAQAVARHALAVFRSQPPPRQKKQDPALDRLIEHLNAVADQLRSLQPSSHAVVEELFESRGQKARLIDLLERTEAFLPNLKEARDALRSHAIALGDAAGGRHHDPRILTFCVRVADAYAEQVRAEPTFSVDPESDMITSPFGLIIDIAFRTLLASVNAPERAIRAAARDAAGRIEHGSWGPR